MDFTVGTMEKLVELLRAPEPEILQGEELLSSGMEITSNRDKIVKPDENKAPRNIEEFEEQESKELEELSHSGAGIEGRKAPEYTMNYQQAVTAEDVFLQVGAPLVPMTMHFHDKHELILYPGLAPDEETPQWLTIGPKTPSSTSCENLILRVKMPGDKKENVDLSVTTTGVTVSSSRYLLKLPLPHGIDPDRSKANWDADLETLVLTLKLDREFDFVNF